MFASLQFRAIDEKEECSGNDDLSDTDERGGNIKKRGQPARK